jgi:membrane-bound ClpP family serine protease
MYRKILDVLTILSTILVLGILGGGFFTFKYVTSEQFKAKMMNQVLENVQGLMPKVLDKALPDTTGQSIPIPFKK